MPDRAPGRSPCLRIGTRSGTKTMRLQPAAACRVVGAVSSARFAISQATVTWQHNLSYIDVAFLLSLSLFFLFVRPPPRLFSVQRVVRPRRTVTSNRRNTTLDTHATKHQVRYPFITVPAEQFRLTSDDSNGSLYLLKCRPPSGRDETPKVYIYKFMCIHAPVRPSIHPLAYLDRRVVDHQLS